MSSAMAMVHGEGHCEEIVKEIETLDVSDASPESLLSAASSLKKQVVDATWVAGSADGNADPTAYAGLLGTALMCMRSYEATGSLEDLRLSAEIVDTCSILVQSYRRDVTFLCGRAGVYALGAAVSNYRRDMTRRDVYLGLFFEVSRDPALPVGPEDGGFGMPYELLHGRSGFLYAAMFINKYLGPGTIPDELLRPVLDAVLAGGRAGSSVNLDCPLMYRWHGTRYLGAAHGLAGIVHVLLHFRLEQPDLHDVKETIRYMIRNRLRQSGNYALNEGNKGDWLVQWSHGAGGVAFMLCKAAEVFGDEAEFRDAAIEAGEVVWRRGLNQRVGLADGIAGNAYVFLSLYRLTKDEVYLERAKAFGGFLCQNAAKLIAHSRTLGTESVYSLFQGLAGVTCLWLDLMSPENARFPGFEL